MNEALIPLHRPKFEKSTEKDDEGALSDLGNPLMTMLSNLGMRVGETSSPNSPRNEPLRKQTISTGLGVDAGEKHLLPNGVNVISAEDLENHLRNVDQIDQEIKAHQPTFTNFDNILMKNGIMGFERTPELRNPPPGFLPPISGNLLPFSIPELPSSNIPQLRHMSHNHTHSNLSAQSQLISAPGTNANVRFSTNEEFGRQFLPVNTSNNKTFVHSSPFGLGLSIGGLEHVIGKHQSMNSQQVPQHELINSSALSYPLPSQNNHQTPSANIDMNPVLTNPQSDGSFSLPLENLFALASESQVTACNTNTVTTETAPWPPRRE